VARHPADHDLSARVSKARLVRPSDPGKPLVAFTVDVEDWYQSSIDYGAPVSERLVRNMEVVLGLLAECGVHGTFFVQGRVAETFPQVVASIVSAGHEVQSHGYSHTPLFELDHDGLRQELDRARKTVEDACGMPVTAFRAQDFSVLRENLWAMDAIEQTGFTLDSSIFPMRTRRYGISRWELAPHHLTLGNGAKILEVPVAIWEVGPMRVPVAGGGYFRVLPRALLEWGLRAIISSGRPAVVYCHPYEFNPGELAEFRGQVPYRTRLSQGIGRASFRQRVKALLESLPFGRLDEVLAAWQIT
jgi:polysaccharide deacetylase family protein (PEP-CTERM system associated)